MLDELVGRAAMTCNPDQFWVTAKLIVRYRKPIPVGKPLHLIGQLKRMSGSRTVSHAEIRLKDGSLGAEAEATLIKSPALDLSERELEALGWKVYPEDS
jgi:acyl-CoA thioesterase FadM